MYSIEPKFEIIEKANKTFYFMKKILVPTDFSANSKNALQYALAIADRFGSQITLLHTVQVIQLASMLKSMDEVLIQEAEQEMEALTKDLSDYQITTQINKGEAIETISKTAKEGGYDLVVMGTKGASGLKEVFIGSVTGGVMRRTDTPILAIPEGYAPKPIKNIVLALANMTLSSESVIQPLLDLTQKLEAEVKIFHVLKRNQTDYDDFLQTKLWLQNLPHSTHIENERGSLSSSILSFVNSVDGDMLCMVHRKRGFIGFFEHIFNKSVTLTEVFNAELPLLILQDDSVID
jgi:nucleotide-binding universal stress UspA family protein